LMDRMGNSFDRSILLATLLKQAGHAIRLAHGTLPADRAHAMLTSLVVARAAGLTDSDAPLMPEATEFHAVATQYHLDEAVIGRSLASAVATGERQFSEVETRLAEQTDRLRAALGDPAHAPDRAARIDQAVEALRDHWWVQRQDGGTWSDLDLLSPDMTALTTARETVALDAVPNAESHRVVCRVISEQWSRGRVSERVALQHVLTPADLIGKPVVLRLWP